MVYGPALKQSSKLKTSSQNNLIRELIDNMYTSYYQNTLGFCQIRVVLLKQQITLKHVSLIHTHTLIHTYMCVCVYTGSLVSDNLYLSVPKCVRVCDRTFAMRSHSFQYMLKNFFLDATTVINIVFQLSKNYEKTMKKKSKIHQFFAVCRCNLFCKGENSFSLNKDSSRPYKKIVRELFIVLTSFSRCLYVTSTSVRPTLLIYFFFRLL